MSEFDEDFKFELEGLASAEAERQMADQEVDATADLYLQQLLDLADTQEFTIPPILRDATFDREEASISILFDIVQELDGQLELGSLPPDRIADAEHDFNIVMGFARLVSAREDVIYGELDENEDEQRRLALGTVFAGRGVEREEKLAFLKLTNIYLDGYLNPFELPEPEHIISDDAISRLGNGLLVQVEEENPPEHRQSWVAASRIAATRLRTLIGEHDDISRILSGIMISAAEDLAWRRAGRPEDFVFMPEDIRREFGADTIGDIMAKSGMTDKEIRAIIDVAADELNERGFDTDI